MVTAYTAATALVIFAGRATASPDDRGTAVCAHMLEASLPHTDGVARKFRIELLNNGHVDTEEEYAAGEMKYDLRVEEAASGRPVKFATCTLSENGEFVAMRMDPRAASLAGRNWPGIVDRSIDMPLALRAVERSRAITTLCSGAWDFANRTVRQIASP